MQPTAAYIHVPFCEHRCGYCDFALVTGRDDLVEPFLKALTTELSSLGRPCLVRTLYVGGGTPSQLTPPQLVQFFEIVQRWLPRAETAEFTVEVNPSDVTAEMVDVFYQSGVNRISVGTQSFSNRKLRALDRTHAVADNHRALGLLGSRFPRVSLDMIFAAPDETQLEWRQDLEAATHQPVSHLSTYGLTYEKGTRFWTDRRRGTLIETDEETHRQMLGQAVLRLSSAGFDHYEVSSFAKPGHRSQHNQVYWKGESFWGFGPGAASYIDGVRTVNHRSTTTYLKRMSSGESPVFEREQLGPQDAARELLVLGLRMREGIDLDAFQQQRGVDPLELCGAVIEELVEHELMELDGARLRVTHEGLFVLDAVFARLLSD